MSEDDDYRVEARLTGASRGISPTTEQIQTLLERQRAHEKSTRPEPLKSFAHVMRDQGRGEGEEDQGEPGAQKGDTADTDADRAQASEVGRDTFVRRSGLPPGFQRSGRPQGSPVAEPDQRVPATVPPTGPPARAQQNGASEPGSAPKKIIIRG